jgi:8-oxo-dGTP pyrophosphatase MutT (NUDIX family)
LAKDDTPDIITLGSRIVYRNNWMTVREDAIRRRDGSTGIYGVIDKPDFVVVVPLHANGSLQLVQQFRYPIGARCWEFPSGTWGPTGTDPALIAQHELQEETGFTAATLTHAGYLHGDFGTINQGYDIFLATGLTDCAAAPEPEEQDIVSRAFSRTEFEAMLLDGTITAAMVAACFGLLRLRGFL